MMILKKVAALCRAAKTAIILDTPDGDQWIGDGRSVYAAAGLPRMDPRELLRMMDIPGDKMDDWRAARMPVPDELDLDDGCEMEWEPVVYSAHLVYRDTELIPVKTSRGLAFIESRYIDPLRDHGAQLELRERVSSNDELYFVLKSGLLVYGAILPWREASESLIDVLTTVAQAGIAGVLARDLGMPGIGIDPDTGEILEGY